MPATSRPRRAARRTTESLHDHFTRHFRHATPADARKESLIEYPSQFPIKVMGAKVDGFVHAVTLIAEQFDPAFDASTVELRHSKAGNYLGVTITVTATSREQLDDHLPGAVRASDGQGGALSTALQAALLGRVDYAATYAAMQQHARRSARPIPPDVLWLCEHAPVYTQGLAGKADHVLDPGEHPRGADRPRRAGHLPRARARWWPIR